MFFNKKMKNRITELELQVQKKDEKIRELADRLTEYEQREREREKLRKKKVQK